MYDTIVIGAGPAGMTAALYAARANLKVATLEQGAPGGQMNNTSDIENYPGFESISGPELSMKMFEPLEKLGVENLYGIVSGIEDKGDYKVVKTGDEEYQTKTVIIATGAKHRHIGVAGEEEYNSRGVSYCAVCDGAFFRDQDLLVIGGGDSAVEEAIYLAGLVEKVTVIHRRDELRAQKILQERAFADDKIEFVWDSVVESFEETNGKLGAVKVKNVKTDEVSDIEAEGAFIYIGLDPITDMIKELEVTDEAGYITVDHAMMTPVPGVFAAGDVISKELRRMLQILHRTTRIRAGLGR